jgi:hypothetical protein
MTQFRKKPLLVDAVPVDDFLEGNPLPEWVAQAMKVEPGAHEARVTRIPNGIDIVTKQGQVVGAGSGEWLLRATPDDLWPIDGDVFEATYEPPDAQVPTPNESIAAVARLLEEGVRVDPLGIEEIEQATALIDRALAGEDVLAEVQALRGGWV